jgi:chromosome segregation ATPase
MEHREAIEEYNSLVQERRRKLLRRADAALARHGHALKLWRAHEAVLEAEVRLVEAASDVKALKERANDIIQKLGEAEKSQKEMETAVKELKARGREMAAQISQLRHEFPDVDIQELAGDKSPEELKNEIEAEESKLELIQVTPPNVLQRYNQQRQQIQRIEQQLETGRRTLEGLNGQISELQGKWEPRLETLVSKVNNAFSYNFEQIGCAGEVRLHRAEDFDQWALHILVSYR